MERTEAASALEAMHHAQVEVARTATCPPWRHAVFGLLMGGLVASPAFAFPIRMAILAVLLCSIPVIIQSDRKRMGMFVNGYRKGKTRIVAFGILAVELSLYAVACYRDISLGDHVTPLLLGGAGVLVGIVGSIIWQRVFVRELGA